MIPPRTLPLVVALAFACNGGGTTDDDPDTDTGPTYEAGCIAVSGDSFAYAFVDDALAEAAPGATITLCEDLSQAIVVSTEITIDATGFKLTPPVNESAVTVVDGGNLTILGATIETTRSAFVVEDGGTLTVQDAELAVVPNYGVDVQAGGTATLERVNMTNPQWGGARVSGGTLTLRDSTISLPGDYGVLVERDGTATLEGNIIEQPTLRDTAQTNLFDIGGTGVWIESGGTANLKNNQILGPEVVGISADSGGGLTLDGDQVLGGFAGVTVRDTPFSATNARVETYFGYGVLCVACVDVELHSVTIETDPDLSRASTPEVDGSIGLFGIEANFTITGTPEQPSRIAGNNYAGALVSPQNGGSRADIDISDAVLDNNAAFGLAVYQGEANLERVSVTNTRNDDAKCNTDSGRACNMAVAYWGANGTIVDSEISDSQDWGLTVVNGVVDISGSTFARNEFVGAFAQQGSLFFEDTDFLEGKQYSLYLTSGASGTIDGSRFRDASYTSDFEYMSGENVIRQVSHYQALDAVVFGSTLTVTNTPFENGQRGIQASGSGTTAEVTIVDSSWKNYHYDLLASFSQSVVSAQRVSFEDIGRYALRCSSGDLRVDRATISGVTFSPYRFEYYQNGELVFDSTSEQYGEPIWTSTCSLRLDDVTVENSESIAAYLNNTSALVNGLTLRDVAKSRSSGGALLLQYTSPTVPSAYFSDVSIAGVQTLDAVRVSSWIDSATGRPSDGPISFTNLSIGGPDEADAIDGDGIDATNVADLLIDGLDIHQVGEFGMRLTRAGAEITGVSSRRTGLIRDVRDAGVRIDGNGTGTSPEKVVLQDLSISETRREGIVVTSGVHDVLGVTVTGAGSWGASCTLPGDLGVCDGSTFDGEDGAVLDCTCSGASD